MIASQEISQVLVPGGLGRAAAVGQGDEDCLEGPAVLGERLVPVGLEGAEQLLVVLPTHGGQEVSPEFTLLEPPIQPWVQL